MAEHTPLDSSGHYYIAPRVKDTRMIILGSVIRHCMQCGDKVLIDPVLLDAADKSLGIICLPDIQEMTNKTLDQLIVENIDSITAIIKEKIRRKDDEQTG